MTSAEWPESILLVRHAESLGNLADQEAYSRKAPRLDLVARDADIELSPTGLDQAASLGQWLARQPADERPTVVIASPYRRAAQTAETAVTDSDLDVPIRRDERLRERDLGWLDGFTSAGIQDRFPEEAQRRDWIGKFYYRPPGGESWCDVALRVRSFLQSLQQNFAGERVMIVTHQAVIMNFRFVLEELTETEVLEIGSSERLANCSMTSYRRDADGTLSLDTYNDVSGLEAMAETVTAEEPVAQERMGDHGHG